MATLLALGCRYGQGYLFSRPLEAERAELEDDMSDFKAWQEVRRRNVEWLTKWEPQRLPGQPDVVEPVALTHSFHGGRVFYTSLGSPLDFEFAFFQRLLLNAIFWAADRPVARQPLQQRLAFADR